MKHKSILRMFTAGVLCCTLCGSGMTVPAFSADDEPELPAKFDLRDEGAMTSVKQQYGGTCTIYSGIAAIESFMIKNGMADNTIDLSESHFSWFTYGKGSSDDPEDPLYSDGQEQGVKGYAPLATTINFTGVLASWKGVAPESETGEENKKQQPVDESRRYESIAHLQNAVEYPLSDPDTIKKNLMKYGAMQIGFTAISTPDRLSEQGGYYETLYNGRQAVSKAYDANEDYVITEKELADAETLTRGDLNRDGKVTAVDLSLLKQMLLGSERTDLCLLAGDWNEDQAINAEDARGLLGFLLSADI